MYNVVRGSVTAPSFTITSYDGSVDGLDDAAGNSTSLTAGEAAGTEGPTAAAATAAVVVVVVVGVAVITIEDLITGEGEEEPEPWWDGDA